MHDASAENVSGSQDKAEPVAHVDRDCLNAIRWTGPYPQDGTALYAAPPTPLLREAMEAPIAVRAQLLEVEAERIRQDGKWGGAEHDDGHTTADFVQLICDYAGWARVMAGMNSPDKARNRLKQVAALAVAEMERMDRLTIKEDKHG